jgi:predicted DNA-binding protein (UPF0251 family)
MTGNPTTPGAENTVIMSPVSTSETPKGPVSATRMGEEELEAVRAVDINQQQESKLGVVENLSAAAEQPGQ